MSEPNHKDVARGLATLDRVLRDKLEQGDADLEAAESFLRARDAIEDGLVDAMQGETRLTAPVRVLVRDLANMMVISESIMGEVARVGRVVHPDGSLIDALKRYTQYSNTMRRHVEVLGRLTNSDAQEITLAAYISRGGDPMPTEEGRARPERLQPPPAATEAPDAKPLPPPVVDEFGFDH